MRRVLMLLTAVVCRGQFVRAGVAAAAAGAIVAKMQGEGTAQNGAVRLTASGAGILVEIRLKAAAGKTSRR